MSKMGEAYIKKLNAEEDAKAMKQRLVSDCCMDEVTTMRSPGDRFTPDQPVYYCVQCGKRCEVLTIDESEEEE